MLHALVALAEALGVLTALLETSPRGPGSIESSRWSHVIEERQREIPRCAQLELRELSMLSR